MAALTEPCQKLKKMEVTMKRARNENGGVGQNGDTPSLPLQE
jgi:hypothetical protein